MRYERFSLIGDDASTIFTRVQGRGWDAKTPLSTAGIEDLTSSISSVGLLQPVLLEQIGDSYVLVSGERRLRAMWWGSINDPDNAHFANLTAIVIEGPIGAEERRRWQLVENVAREDLRPAELAAGLLYQRSAMLVTKLLTRGVSVADIHDVDDPVQLWDALNQRRLEHDLHDCGAPWAEVVKHLGIALSPQRAEAFVRAFRALPKEQSADMDAKQVSLASREAFIRLQRSGRTEAAAGIWAAIGDDRPELLTRACSLALDTPEDADVDIDEVIETAAFIHDRVLEEPEEITEAAVDELAGVVDGLLIRLEELLALIRQGAPIRGYRAGSLLIRLRETTSAIEGT